MPTEETPTDGAAARRTSRMRNGAEPATRTTSDAPLARPRSVHAGGERPGYLHRFVVKDGRRYLLIRAEEVDWIEAVGNYARLHTNGETHLVRATMKTLDRRLDPRRFVRIHRSTIVNLDRVAEIRPAGEQRGYAVVLRDGVRLRLGRTYRKRLLG